MQIINGKKIAEQIRSELKDKISKLENKLGLAVILVGEDPASHLYVSLKEKACREVGIDFESWIFPAFASEEELLKKINELNNRKEITGILVQLPLPQQDADKIIAAIDPAKDIDGFHPENLRRLEKNEPCLVSPVVLGVMRLFEETKGSLFGKKAILVMSEIFAKPFRVILEKSGAMVETVSSDDPELKEKTKNGDVLITAVGHPDLITGEMIQDGATIIDIGTSRVENRVVGDVNQTSVKTKAGWLTPVPGGVGPMTVAMLLQNIFDANTQKTKLKIV